MAHQKEDIEKDFTYIGYNKLYKLALRISGKFKRLADKLYFEQFKMKFGEQDSDIYIVTFPKSGTTLLQMILYQLTTTGGADFDHIYDVSPWIRNASFLREKPKSFPAPRVIKSHDYYHEFEKNKKGRFIFAFRDGMDVAVSLYHQNKNYNKANLDFDEYMKQFLKNEKKSWFNHSREWFNNKNGFPVLYIRYEDLINNKRREIERIIQFCQLDADEATIQRAMEFSSFEFMKAHEEKFGVQPRVKEIVYDQFIRKGVKGEGEKTLSDQQKQVFYKHYNNDVKPLELKIFQQ
jgi:Sulfotransferase domain